MSFHDRFTSLHIDVLKEIGNIGAGNAASSLSRLLDRSIHMHVPDARIVGFDEVMELSGGADQEVVSVFLRMEGEAPGNMFFILNPEQAEQFIQQLTGLEAGLKSGDELSSSALHELGNILAGSYLTALADFTGLELHPSVPSISMDMAGAILSTGLLELSIVTDQAIVIETALTDKAESGTNMEGHFFLFPDPDAYAVLFEALGVTKHE
ncbi:chemotaxis protein CheC [Halobacillus fulvus]|nr:chemotaxis protein CheC [Halobacillus fulvus]